VEWKYFRREYYGHRYRDRNHRHRNTQHLSADDDMSTVPWSFMSGGILAILVLVGVFVIWRVLKDRRLGFPSKDERTQKVTGMAATYAFYLGSYFMVALMLTNLLSQEMLGVPLLEEGYAIIGAILVQNLTFLGVRIYLNRKGDL
jgi:hypothetical protein